MKSTEVFSSKAEKYAKYRWDYAPQAISVVMRITRLDDQSIVADIGAGTGILSRHFACRVKQVYAIEPNHEMRKVAQKELSQYEGCTVLAGQAEAVPIASQSVDLISVGQALHWFEPKPTRTEFLRILKPSGWLVVLRNYGLDPYLNEAIERICVSENGVAEMNLPGRKPPDYYFGHEEYKRLTFRFIEIQDWERFSGSLLTASYMPEESHPLYPKMVHAIGEVFGRFSQGGKLQVLGETEVNIGQIVR